MRTQKTRWLTSGVGPGLSWLVRGGWLHAQEAGGRGRCLRMHGLRHRQQRVRRQDHRATALRLRSRHVLTRPVPKMKKPSRRSAEIFTRAYNCGRCSGGGRAFHRRRRDDRRKRRADSRAVPRSRPSSRRCSGSATGATIEISPGIPRFPGPRRRQGRRPDAGKAGRERGVQTRFGTIRPLRQAGRTVAIFQRARGDEPGAGAPRTAQGARMAAGRLARREPRLDRSRELPLVGRPEFLAPRFHDPCSGQARNDSQRSESAGTR